VVSNLFWDSGVFTAFLCDQKDAYDVASIEKYLNEAKAGDVRIFTSTIASAEVLPGQLVRVGAFEDFLQDFHGAVVPVDPMPNVMRLSGRLRDLPYKKGKSTKRRLGTPDAIILATAIHLQDDYGVKLDAFHTFDGGGRKDLEGNRSIPMLGFEGWCEGFTPDQLAVAQRVIDLPRCKPIHPDPGLDFNAPA
jgi:predicted nucleic acid-binding protein